MRERCALIGVVFFLAAIAVGVTAQPPAINVVLYGNVFLKNGTPADGATYNVRVYDNDGPTLLSNESGIIGSLISGKIYESHNQPNSAGDIINVTVKHGSEVGKWSHVITEEERGRTIVQMPDMILDYGTTSTTTVPTTTTSTTVSTTTTTVPTTTTLPYKEQPHKPKIVLLANSIDYELATDFFGFLRNTGIEIVHVNATEFEDYKTEKFIVILGGPDAPEGIGNIAREVLNLSEQEELRIPGAKKMYVKKDVWKSYNQVVFVVAGSDRERTRECSEEHKLAVKARAKG